MKTSAATVRTPPRPPMKHLSHVRPPPPLRAWGMGLMYAAVAWKPLTVTAVPALVLCVVVCLGGVALGRPLAHSQLRGAGQRRAGHHRAGDAGAQRAGGAAPGRGVPLAARAVGGGGDGDDHHPA